MKNPILGFIRGLEAMGCLPRTPAAFAEFESEDSAKLYLFDLYTKLIARTRLEYAAFVRCYPEDQIHLIAAVATEHGYKVYWWGLLHDPVGHKWRMRVRVAEV